MTNTLSFKQTMLNAGLPIEKTPIADGCIHRFGLQEDRNKPCWYILYPDIIPHGAFGCWKRGLSKTWWGGIGRIVIVVNLKNSNYKRKYKNKKDNAINRS